MSIPNHSLEIAMESLRIAVLIPCLNEEKTIGKVVTDMKSTCPGSVVYVYDNNSSDCTVAEAQAAGAIVGRETLPGKGSVVNRMFADIEADVYVLIDGDDTYDASSTPLLVHTLINGPYDMVTAARVAVGNEAYRHGHRFGNVLLTGLAGAIFGSRVSDMLSGFRAFSRRFVKSFAGFSTGFEIETELTVHALDMRMPIAEIETPYGMRVEGSTSKLRTFKDGLVILLKVVGLAEEEKPLTFFGLISVFLGVLSLILGIPEVILYMQSGSVSVTLSFMMASLLMVVSGMSLVCGLILNTVTRGRKEMKRLKYISFPPVGWHSGGDQQLPG